MHPDLPTIALTLPLPLSLLHPSCSHLPAYHHTNHTLKIMFPSSCLKIIKICIIPQFDWLPPIFHHKNSCYHNYPLPTTTAPPRHHHRGHHGMAPRHGPPRGALAVDVVDPNLLLLRAAEAGERRQVEAAVGPWERQRLTLAAAANPGCSLPKNSWCSRMEFTNKMREELNLLFFVWDEGRTRKASAH